jgi:hypothetical protein
MHKYHRLRAFTEFTAFMFLTHLSLLAILFITPLVCGGDDKNEQMHFVFEIN